MLMAVSGENQVQLHVHLYLPESFSLSDLNNLVHFGEYRWLHEISHTCLVLRLVTDTFSRFLSRECRLTCEIRENVTYSCIWYMDLPEVGVYMDLPEVGVYMEMGACSGQHGTRTHTLAWCLPGQYGTCMYDTCMHTLPHTHTLAWCLPTGTSTHTADLACLQ